MRNITGEVRTCSQVVEEKGRGRIGGRRLNRKKRKICARIDVVWRLGRNWKPLPTGFLPLQQHESESEMEGGALVALSRLAPSSSKKPNPTSSEDERRSR